MNSALTEQFQMLRASVEKTTDRPRVILITSALVNDGKNVCSQGLAESMSSAGYRTLLVDLDHTDPSLQGLPPIASLGADGELPERGFVTDPRSGVTMISLANSDMSRSASTERIARTLEGLRGRFEAIIIDAARLADSSVSVLFAGYSDAVIVTAREGRSVKREDKAMLEIIERQSLKFLGVVTVSSDAIKSFEKSSATSILRSSSVLVGGRSIESQMAAGSAS